MNPHLALPFIRRVPTWHALLFLPVMPIVGLIGHTHRPAAHMALLPVLGLILLGTVLALGLSRIMSQSSAAMRKEVELLRVPWLLSHFIVQVPIAFLDASDVEPWIPIFLGLACALIGSIPFGAEFQQGTVSGLLSQPVQRSVTWRSKMSILGAALLLQGGICLLSLMASGHRVDKFSAASVPLILVAAWATAPFWTLLTRGLVAGFVFCVATPLLVLVIGSSLVDSLPATALVSDKARNWIQSLEEVLLYVGFPLYCLFAVLAGRSRWMRLEAIDSPGQGESGVFLTGWKFLPRLGRGTPCVARLISKELRLQTVSLISGALTLVLFLFTGAINSEWHSRQLLDMSVILMGTMTLLLAGATSIAEERRLGLLDTQSLLPIRRSTQWWVKVGVALALALGGGVIVRLALGETLDQDRWIFPRVVLPILFVATLLASSVSGTALRALFGGIALAGATIAVGGIAISHGFLMLEQARDAVAAAALSNPGDFRLEVEQMTPEALERLSTHSGPTSALHVWLALAALGMLILFPCLLATYFAWRNFAQPAEGSRRLPRQILVWLLTVVVEIYLIAFVARTITTREHRMEYLRLAWEDLRFVQQLTPAERALWDQAGHFELNAPRTVRVSFAGEPRQHRSIELPLDTSTRDLLLQHADLPQTCARRFTRMRSALLTL